MTTGSGGGGPESTTIDASIVASTDASAAGCPDAPTPLLACMLPLVGWPVPLCVEPEPPFEAPALCPLVVEPDEICPPEKPEDEFPLPLAPFEQATRARPATNRKAPLAAS
jgi:hypothetical protein